MRGTPSAVVSLLSGGSTSSSRTASLRTSGLSRSRRPHVPRVGTDRKNRRPNPDRPSAFSQLVAGRVASLRRRMYLLVEADRKGRPDPKPEVALRIRRHEPRDRGEHARIGVVLGLARRPELPGRDHQRMLPPGTTRRVLDTVQGKTTLEAGARLGPLRRSRSILLEGLVAEGRRKPRER